MTNAKKTEIQMKERKKINWPPLANAYYSDNAVAIYHGDCLELMPKLDAESIDLVLTDPPYGHRTNDGDLIHHIEGACPNRRPRGWTPKMEATAARPIANDGPEANDIYKLMLVGVHRLLKPGCCCCCCCSGGGGPAPQFARWSLWMDEVFSFMQMLIWDKGGLGLGWHYRRSYETILVGSKPGAAINWHGGNSVSNVLRHGKIIPRKDDHPTPKPVSLMKELISNHTAPGELIIDPFMGGGTTLRAAKDLGRRAIGIELDEKYCEMATSRCRQEVFDIS